MQTSSSSLFSKSGTATYLIPEAGMRFDYSTTVFQEPVRWSTTDLNGKFISDGWGVSLFKQNEPVAGAGNIRFSFMAEDFVPEYETWYSDFIGKIATESTLETVCSSPYLKGATLVSMQCSIVQEPVPHAELFIGDGHPERSYSLHKAAIFFTNKSEHPGVFVHVYAFDVPVSNAVETKEKMEELASGKVQSAFVQEFDRIISSIRFE